VETPEKGNITLREVKMFAEGLAEMIRKASPYQQEGIKLVTKMVAKELLESGFSPPQLIQISSTILEATTEYLKQVNKREA
jgi:hypothetical protein